MRLLARPQPWTVSTAVVATLILASAAGAAVSPPQAKPRRPVVAAPIEDSLLATLPVHHQVPIPAVVVTRHHAHAAPAVRLLPSADGIPAVALTAYRHAAHLANAADSTCHLPWQLVAAVGYIESDHGQIGGDSLTAAGDEASPIEGLALDGTNGVAHITDGRGHAVRAEGPLQFIPSTWATWQVDANGDGHADPQNIFDASAAAARYLCAGGIDLSTVEAQAPAITSYNDSPIYVKNVENVERAYLAGRTADTVTLIPMQGCPPASAKPWAKTAASAASNPTPSAPAGCPAPAVKTAKPHKPAPVHLVAARRTVAPVPRPAPKPAAKPTSPPTPAHTTAPSPAPSPSPIVSPSPSPAAAPSAAPTATPTP